MEFNSRDDELSARSPQLPERKPPIGEIYLRALQNVSFTRTFSFDGQSSLPGGRAAYRSRRFMDFIRRLYRSEDLAKTPIEEARA